ncbi:MAG TPA: hypothetical protein VF533_13755 [Solirubrobacteraceae bacterium]|jgi:hypothetical protein
MRSVLLALTVAVLAGAAPATAAVCRYEAPKPLRSAQQRAVDRAVAARKDLGFRHDRRYVRRVNADRASRRRGNRFYHFAITRREAVYLRGRARFQDARRTRRLDAYVRRHAEAFGVLSIEDDYPRGAYMQVRVTRDLARHRRAVRRRFALRFRIKRVGFSERELTRIHDRIDADEEALRAEGIEVLGGGVATERVEVAVTTPRDDASAFLRARYGPAVRVHVLGATPTYLDCFGPESYRLAADGRTLELSYTGSGSLTPREPEVVEEGEVVGTGMVFEVPRIGLDGDAVRHTLTVTLSAPLGGRTVRSIVTGRPVPRRGAGQRESAPKDVG